MSVPLSPPDTAVPETRKRQSLVEARLAADRLGVPAVLSFALTAATPLTVVAGVATTGFAMTGLIGLPVAFLAIGVLLALFSVGYVTMAGRIPHAGAFYSFVARGLGRPAGVGTAWLAVFAYSGLLLSLYGMIGVAAPPLIASWLGVNIPWWVASLACWALVAVLGTQAVDINGKALTILLIVEIAVIGVFSISNLANPADGAVSFTALSPAELFGPGVGAILALAVLGFIGFEAPSVYSEEAKNPRRTVAVATFWCIGVLAVVYAGSTWAMTVAVGPDNIVAASQEQGIEVMFGLAGAQLGAVAATIGNCLLITSVIAAAASFHSTVARYVFALGREGVLPAALGRTSRKSAPRNASIAQSAIGALVIIGYAVFDLDPLVDLFYLTSTAGGVGVLAVIAVTAAAIVVYFHRNRQPGDGVWRTGIAPVAATITTVGVLYLAIYNFRALLGAPPESLVPYVVPISFAVIALAGIGWGFILASHRPGIYACIGAGAAANPNQKTPSRSSNS